MLAAISADHIWPALYPAIIVGGLIGMTTRSVVGAALGIAGALAGALAGVWLIDLAGLKMSILRLAVTLALCAAASYAAISFWRRPGRG